MFDLNIVAAVLTIIGYSINDKMVIDDRIRENMRTLSQDGHARRSIDLSVNETLPRTVMTSVTILLALFALLIFGGRVLRGFTAAMILGIVVGTYSSIYVSSSLLISLGLRGPSRRAGERRRRRLEGRAGRPTRTCPEAAGAPACAWTRPADRWPDHLGFPSGGFLRRRRRLSRRC